MRSAVSVLSRLGQGLRSRRPALFALAFALDQLPQNLEDLADRCHDLHRGRRQ